MRLTLLLFLSLEFFAFAQNDSLQRACEHRNVMIFPENLHGYFGQRLADHPGELKIVQIGDSHVQMAQFPGALCNTLDTLVVPTTENSFWFPYALFGGYTPKGFTVSCKNAVAEKMVNSRGENRFTITGYALKVLPVPYGVQEIEISCVKKKFAVMQLIVERNDDWTIAADSAVVKKEPMPGNLDLYTITSFAEQSAFTYRLVNTRNTQPLRIYGFREPVAVPQQEFQFYGASGAKLSDFAGASLLSGFIGYEQPDLFIISLGTNDSYIRQRVFKLRKNIVKIVKSVRGNSQASILFTLPPDTYFENQSPRSIHKVRRQVLKVAKKEQCAVWDFASVMGGEGSVLAWHSLRLTNGDLLHLNNDGYNIQGKLLAEALFMVYISAVI